MGRFTVLIIEFHDDNPEPGVSISQCRLRFVLYI